MRVAQVTIMATAMLVTTAACDPQSQLGSEQQFPPPPAQNNRPQITATECIAVGGQVIGDPGDGRIHQAGFRCPNGQAPVGSIAAETGQPIAVEGAVCCSS